jgi:hypothetical protein
MLLAALHRAKDNCNYVWGSFVSAIEKVLELWSAGHEFAWLARCVNELTLRYNEIESWKRLDQVLRLIEGLNPATESV